MMKNFPAFFLRHRRGLLPISLGACAIALLFFTHGPAKRVVSVDYEVVFSIDWPDEVRARKQQTVQFRDALGRSWSEKEYLTEEPFPGGQAELERRMFEKALSLAKAENPVQQGDVVLQ
ncbi:hypothetical protein SH661x_001119 [Planctomicrobium sp. SH661]|uniref:hypothetical protein n=1 Tax=Planctomicrobium sp. SH661 TaxID=3448124 RepID=UPI003F5B24F1